MATDHRPMDEEVEVDPDEQNDYQGFTLQPVPSGMFKAILDPGVHPEIVLLGLQKLYTREDISRLDLSNFPTEETTGNDDHLELSKMILPFALKDSVISIATPNHWVHKVKGACKGIVVNTIREVTGPYVNILGREIQVKDAVDPQDFMSKIVDYDDSLAGEMLNSTYQVLKSVRTMPDIPHTLGDLVINAAKHIRRIRKSRRKRRNFLKIQKNLPELDTDDDSDDSTESSKNGKDQDTPSSSKPDVQTVPNEVIDLLGTQGVCYVCKKAFTFASIAKKIDESWIQYSKMCQPCAIYNFQKRNQKCNLEGRYAVVTGGRIKIGFHIVLKLLRDGCHVITTTRFPLDAAKRFQEENDFDSFKERLKIYPLDLKNMNGIHYFVDYVKKTFPHLDILINNAAQTIRRPKDFFQHMLQYEMTPTNEMSEGTKLILAIDQKLEYGIQPVTYPKHTVHPIQEVSKDQSSTNKVRKKRKLNEKLTLSTKKIKTCSTQQRVKTTEGFQDNPEEASTSSATSATVTSPQSSNVSPLYQVEHPVSDYNSDSDVSVSSCPSQGPSSLADTSNIEPPIPVIIPGTPTSSAALSTYFPPGLLDEDGQQLDLRPKNSWRMELEEVPVPELLEVLAINAVAPFILTQRLKLWLDKSPFPRRFVVNVSAMEGQFSRIHKNHYHPHTNMAKASLNMLTRTAAIGYREQGVYMTAVDTGWVTDERPYPQAKHEENKGFMLPLDSIDGAARVYDPIVTGLSLCTEPHYAVFLKDYKPFPW